MSKRTSMRFLARWQVVCLGILVSVLSVCASSSAGTVEFFSKSERLIQGFSPQTGVWFTAISFENRGDQIDVELGGKRVFLRISPETEEVNLRGYDIEADGPAVFNQEDLDKLAQLLDRVLQEDLRQGPLSGMLLRVLNLLASWPEDQPVLLRISGTEITSLMEGLANGPSNRFGANGDIALQNACAWPPSLELSESLCTEINQSHSAEYISLGAAIGRAPKPFDRFKIFFPLQCSPFSETVGPYPFDTGECFGRCGKGCIGDGPPNNQLNIFTQNCFAHDGCVAARGLTDPYCNQMFVYTVRDFLFGTNCIVPQ